MASWLKKIKPITLHQSNDIPYIILELGVLLCFDNFYSESKELNLYKISFLTEKKPLKRKTTNYYELKNFPRTIEFQYIIELNDCISDNGMNLIKPPANNEEQNICIITDEYIQNIDKEISDGIFDDLKEYHYSFVLLKNEGLTDDVRDVIDAGLFPITHVNWYRTAVIIADQICELSNRNYCWTASLPEMNIDVFGIINKDEYYYIKKCFSDIGIRNIISWKTQE